MTLDLLPWETQPDVPKQQTESIEWNGGRLELPRLGYLTVDELELIRQIDPQNALYRLTSDVAVILSRLVEGQSPRQCFALLTALQGRELGAAVKLTEEQEAIQITQAAVIGPFLEQARSITNRVVIRSVTAILTRVRPDWSDERTMKLPPALFNLIHAFEQEEERSGRGPGDPAEDMRSLEEALGKLQQVAIQDVTGPTGGTPTGNAAASGLAPLSSAASGSGSSRAATSSRRSKRATAPKGIGSTAKS